MGGGEVAHLVSVLFCHMHGPGSSLVPTAPMEALTLVSFILFASLPLAENKSVCVFILNLTGCLSIFVY